uniref:60S ribosomal protein L6 n=1 Tax=Cacopsylla melanoneura TaxID=428564 RepID=A0A8D9A7K4_9HEMI
MADTKAPAKAAAKPKVAKPAAAVKPAAGDKKKKELKFLKAKPSPKQLLKYGIYRYGRSQMYHKKGIWKFVGKKMKTTNPLPKKPVYKIKPIGGEKNGKERKVLVRKPKAYYPTKDKIKKTLGRRPFRKHVRRIRSSLTPGTIVILVAGVHKGKRAVFLKQLDSGLLLVTGPFTLNAVPLRRVHQNYVIATSTKLDISSVKIPEQATDYFFRRIKKHNKQPRKGDKRSLFAKRKKRAYKVSKARKVMQKDMDEQLLKVIKVNPEKKVLLSYLASTFGLRSSQYPHRLKF